MTKTLTEQYLELDAAVVEVWNAIQTNPALNSDLKMHERYERLADERDALRERVSFVLECEAYTTEPSSYEDAWTDYQEAEKYCKYNHKIVPV